MQADTSPPRPPRILLLPDKRGWAFDNCAQALRKHLKNDFQFDIRYTKDRRPFRADGYDLVYVFFWGEELYKAMSINSDRLIKRLASHRWEEAPYGPCTPRQLVKKYLCDAAVVHCTSKRLHEAIHQFHPTTYQLTNGYDEQQFRMVKPRQGHLVIGWAGKLKDPVKDVERLLRPACRDQFDLRIAPGNVPHQEMNAFYNQVDVIAVTSRHEGQPMPLIEAMASGCFPVATDVGIVPEVVRHGVNGLIIPERTPEAFQAAFQWCEENLELVRTAGRTNAEKMRNEYRWEVVAPRYRAMFSDALARANRPKFRNDDVSWDTPFNDFREFCQAFWRHHFVQVHGVTLRGRTCVFATFGPDGTQYEGVAPLSKLPNSEIRRLSQPYRFEERRDLIDFLAASPDEIALHGLYHTDHSVMSETELRSEISEGLELLDRLFPNKIVRYFIAPFNRTSEALLDVCRTLNLEVLGAQGLHLEQRIEEVVIEPNTWYRYHHHRFYPESTSAFYPTTMESLRKALARRCAVPGESRSDSDKTSDSRSAPHKAA